MTRPTREQVDRALRDSERYADIGDFTESVAVTLAAEVRALRELADGRLAQWSSAADEVAKLRGQNSNLVLSVEVLSATIARVEALVAGFDMDIPSHACAPITAEAIHKALKGGE